METYAPSDLLFEKGSGSWLYSNNGEKYLDFSSGIAVTSIGHCHPHLVNSIKRQAEKLIHTSNLYKIEQQEKLAERLCSISFADKVFFANSGAEANEGAVKLARKYMFENGQVKRNKIVCIEGGFHGRTIAMLAATSKKENRVGFGPLPRGFKHVKFRNIDSLDKFLDDTVAAIMVEPVQGEGGARKISEDILKSIQFAAKKHNCLIISDEVQTGIGRLGKMFGYENSSLKPDIMALAKGLGGGLPVGAVLARKKISSVIKPGSHGSTFGGNPLSMAAANAVLDIILEPGFLDNVKIKSKYLFETLESIKYENQNFIEEIRGEGLLIGVQLHFDQSKFIKSLEKNYLLTIRAAENVIRILPPLNVKKNEIDLALKILKKVCREYK